MLGLLVVLAPEVSLRAKASFAATCVAFAILFVATSYSTYGAVLPPYYAPAQVSRFRFANLAGVLHSPSRGLVWFMPSALLLCFTPLFVWRDRRLLVASLVAVSAVVAAISVLGGFAMWWGGFSYGPRLFQFALPAVALLALILAKGAGQMNRPTRAGLFSLFAVVAAWEAFVHIGGVSSPRGMAWNVSPVSVDTAPDRLWDWSDPQFLAAFRKRRLIRATAPKSRTHRQSDASCADVFGRAPRDQAARGSSVSV